MIGAVPATLLMERVSQTMSPAEHETSDTPSRFVWKNRWILGVAAVWFVLDQVSKAIVRAALEPHMRPRSDVFFHFTHQINTGIVGGAFREYPWVAWIAPIFALGMLVYLFREMRPESLLPQMAFGLIIGGAFGNIVDRVLRGGVTDFFQFHFMFLPEGFWWRYYPAFNVADSGIVVGLFILMLTWRGNEKAHVADTARPRTD